MNRGRAPRVGFSLLEVVIAMGIVLVLIAIVSRLQSQSGQKVTASANTFLGIHLAGKVLADLLEESRLHGDVLGLFQRYSEMGTKDSVVDGSSVYFRYIRDRIKPWGFIDLAREGGVRKEDGILYQQLQPFAVQVKAERAAPGGSTDWRQHYAEGSIEFSWVEKGGRSRSYAIPFQSFSPTGLLPPEGIELNEEELSRQMRDFLFPQVATLTFDQCVVREGIDPELARAVGRLGVVTAGGKAGVASLAAEIHQLGLKARTFVARPGSELLGLQRTIARRADAAASLIFQILVEIEPDFALIRQKSQSILLERLPPGPYKCGLEAFRSLLQDLSPWLEQARRSYEWFLQDALVLSIAERDRELALSKTLDAIRLQVALREAPASDLHRFVAREKVRAVGRNPYWEKVFLSEERSGVSAATIRQRFPQVDQVCRSIEDRFKPDSQAVDDLVRRHPGMGATP